MVSSLTVSGCRLAEPDQQPQLRLNTAAGLPAGRQELRATMDSDNSLKTETFLRRVFKVLEVESEGKISSEEVGRVLTALGRPQDEETRQNLLNRHGGREV